MICQTHFGIDVGCVGVKILAKVKECFLTCNTCTNGGNITVGRNLIEEIENVSLVGVCFAKGVQNAVVIAVTVGKDPRFNNILILFVSCNVQSGECFINVFGTFCVVSATVDYNGIAIGKLYNVAQADHRVVGLIYSFNTDLNKGQFTRSRRFVGDECAKQVFI